jgi:hypothetical protein
LKNVTYAYVDGEKRAGFYSPDFWRGALTDALATSGMGWSEDVWLFEEDRLPTLVGLSGQTGDAGIYNSGQNLRFADAGAGIVPGTDTAFPYDGSEKAPQVENVKFGDKALTAGKDYKILGATDAGSYEATVTGVGDYIGDYPETFSFTIDKANRD